MNFRTVLTLIVVGFVVFCGWLVFESMPCENCRPERGPCILLQQTTATEGKEETKAVAAKKETLEAADVVRLWASDANDTNSVSLGSIDPNSGFKFHFELIPKGAAIKRAILSEFDDRDYKDPQPLVILSPVDSEILSMANKELVLTLNGQEYKPLPTDRLHWESLGVKRGTDGSETVSFQAVITVKDTGAPIVKLIKTYKITRYSYILDCELIIENLTDSEQKVHFNFGGPVGIGREAVRSDMRNLVSGFLTSDKQVVASRKDLLVGFPMNLFTKNVGLKDTTRKYKEALRQRDQDKINTAKKDLQIGRNLPDSQKHAGFLWAAITNKYFAAILRPVPQEGKDYCDWVNDKTAQYYNPDGDEKGNTGDETIGLDLEIGSRTRPLVIQANSAKTFNFQLYLGPKDKSLFDKKEALLFSTGLEHQSDLDNGTISKSMHQGFRNNGIQLSEKAGISIKEKGQRWLITDNREKYRVSIEEGKLNIYHRPYHRLGFAHTVTFMPCCCCFPCIIKPIAFAILWLMKWMHGFWPYNYGVVIIILVFLFRLAMHPITKKSQISMSKMTKLGPKTEEIRKKYANNKAEMNKQIMALYKEQGASPIMGFLPMMVQMPIWIALWSAIYASIELRGAGFLPFWITDLSMPDALVRFSTITVPLLGWKIESLNLLPLLMGVAMYLQQKLMPSQASAASANPQVAQQQKIMMIMMPLFLPLVLYKAPSGVNLYIMSSTFAGVFEQYFIRKHIREKEEAESKGLVAVTSKTGGKVKKKKPKPFYKI